MSYPTLAEITHPRFGSYRVGVPFKHGNGNTYEIHGYNSKFKCHSLLNVATGLFEVMNENEIIK
jgi:hypothetical protein